MSIFEGCGIEELLDYRKRIRQRILFGQRTRVSVAGGMADEFSDKDDAELRQLMDEINAKLHELDPDTYPNSPDTSRPGETIPIFY